MSSSKTGARSLRTNDRGIRRWPDTRLAQPESAIWEEIQTKYHPDFLWLDDVPIFTRDGNKVRSGKAKPKIKYLDDQLRGMIADFMNDAAERGQEVYCNNKGGNRYWKVFEQKNEHLAFTTNGKRLCAIKLAKPGARFAIKGTADWKKGTVTSVKLLGSSADVKWELTNKGLTITPPKDLGASEHAWAFEIITTEEQHHTNVDVGDADNAIKTYPEVAKRLRSYSETFKEELAQNSRPAAFVADPQPLTMTR